MGSIHGGTLAVLHGYISWFYKVSIIKVVPSIEGEPPKPTNMEVLIEGEHGKDNVDIFQLIKSVRTIALDGMENGTS